MPNPLYTYNRGCTACSLRARCKGPVPGDGPVEAEVLLVAEAPGRNEDEKGLPFQGDAGRELDRFLGMIDLPRESVFITNTVKCRPSATNRTPTAKEARYCATIWLQQELRLVKPRIVVAMGVVAAQYLLGDKFHGMEQDHGRPQEVEISGRTTVVLPVYHPAAGLREKRYMEFAEGDFRKLGMMLGEEDGGMEEVVDQWAGVEDYRLWTPNDGLPISQPLAIDTESLPNGTPYLISVSWEPGIGYVVIPELFSVFGLVLSNREMLSSNSITVFHNLTYDVGKVLAQLGIRVPIEGCQDTMLMAHLLQLESRGLKELAHRYCGMEMKEYSDLVRPGQLPLSTRYLEAVCKNVWPWPEEELGPRGRKHPIEKRAAKILADTVNKGADPWVRWMGKDMEELREVVERELGEMPQAGLDSANWEEVVWYSARDADSTLRLYHVLREMMSHVGS